MNLGIQASLLQAATALSNINADANLKAMFANYGYDDAKFTAGGAFLAAAKASQEKKNKEYADQYKATEVFQRSLTESRATYMEYVKIARIALKNSPAHAAALGLTGQRSKDFTRLAGQMDIFYANALSDAGILAKLAGYGLTDAKLSAGQAAFAATNGLYHQQQREIAGAQDSTQHRDKDLDALTDWMANFIGIARLALAEHPQLLTALGV